MFFFSAVNLTPPSHLRNSSTNISLAAATELYEYVLHLLRPKSSAKISANLISFPFFFLLLPSRSLVDVRIKFHTTPSSRFCTHLRKWKSKQVALFVFFLCREREMQHHTTCYASESAAFAGALIVTFFDRQSDAFSPGGSREQETSPPAALENKRLLLRRRRILPKKEWKCFPYPRKYYGDCLPTPAATSAPVNTPSCRGRPS